MVWWCFVSYGTKLSEFRFFYCNDFLFVFIANVPKITAIYIINIITAIVVICCQWILLKNALIRFDETPFIIDNKYDVDIDTIEDFNRAEMEIKKWKNQNKYYL